MAHNEDGFSFQLEEVLSFERGQEVGDMISVFLDPDITVQSLQEDIAIRGMIELQGEYERARGQMEKEEHLLNADTFEQRNFVDKVVDIGEERAIFSHHFPVEISIPHYRVTKIEDISMDIEHFDYEIIAPDEMKVQSSILIRGVNNEERAYDSLDTNEENEALFTIIEQEESKEEAEGKMETLASTSERSPQPEPEDSEVDLQAIEPMEHDEVTERVHEEEEESIQEEESIEEEQLQVSTRSLQEKETTQEEEGQETRNLDYLTSMFGGENENGHAKVRLCIVQERDTVDSIAERYNIQKKHIVKKNQLETEDLVEGQLLQIPLGSKN